MEQSQRKVSLKLTAKWPLKMGEFSLEVWRFPNLETIHSQNELLVFRECKFTFAFLKGREISFLPPLNQHGNGKWTMNEDAFPTENGDISLP